MEYARNGEGSFVVETPYNIPGVGHLCFDATRRYRDVGRLINHAPSPHSDPIDSTAPTTFAASGE